MPLTFNNTGYSSTTGFFDSVFGSFNNPNINCRFFSGIYKLFEYIENNTNEVSGINLTRMDSISTSPALEFYQSNIAGYKDDTITFSTGISARLYLDTYNNTNVFGSSFRGRRFRGTTGTPSGVLQDDALLQLVGDGYSQSGNIENASVSIAFRAAENFQSGKRGTYIEIYTAPTGGGNQTKRLHLDSQGNLGIKNYNPQYTIDVSGTANFTNGIYLNNAPIQSLFSGGSVPSNSEIFRNTSGQITGIKFDNNFSKIYRNAENKITGVYYNSYFKKILYNEIGNITGVNIIYY